MRAVLLFILAIIAAPAFAQVGGDVPQNPALMRIHDDLRARAQLWGDFERGLAKVKSPKPYAGLYFEECGRANAFFDLKTKKIVVCYEMAHDAARKAGAGGQGAAGYILFVILHEYGHALIHAAKTPPLGREEDAADQIAAILLKKMGSMQPVVHDMMQTSWAPKANENKISPSDMADEHSLTPQRRANVICWGGDYAMIDAAVRARILNPHRANKCAAESEQAEAAVKALILQ